jgi:uncharacterized protein (TIGR00304 family)
MGIAVWRGEAQAGLFLIFPYISGGGLFLGLGLLLVIVGFVVLVLGSVSRFGAMTLEEFLEDEPPVRKKKQRPRTVGDQEVEAPRARGGFKGGGVVFIGPVPIVFGPNAKVTKLMLYLSIVLVIALCLLFFALSFRGI